MTVPADHRTRFGGQNAHSRFAVARIALAAVLTAGGCFLTGRGSGEWAYNSMADWSAGTILESRTWDDDEGFTQQIDLCADPADGHRYYVYHAFISVCGSVQAVCKPHRFDAAFDETGAFLGYRVDALRPFTKAAHDPFHPHDYDKLDEILRNPVHPLADLPPPRRAVKNSGEGIGSGVDAVTGATVAYYAEHAIPKAFYTTHAIWYLVNRSAPERLQTWTLSWAGVPQVRHWMERCESLKVWWFLDHLEKSTLKPDTAAGLCYELLAAKDAKIQSAALRYIRRSGAPFRPAQCLGDSYASLPDDARPDFLEWWTSADYRNPVLGEALRIDLESRIDRSSPVAAAILKYLLKTGLPTGNADAWRGTLRQLTEKNPSTYLRTKAWQLLEGAEK